MEYPFQIIEKKWQKYWTDNKLFHASNEKSEKPTYYVLSMFPYASGVLHMGHISNYSIADAIARYKMMKGFKVMQPMGYDSFGLPAENFAIKHNSHPEITTHENIKKMTKQFKSVGFGYDWSRKVITCDKEYYKWNQWFFLKMYENGLVYRKKSTLNWCPECKTVLANEQAEGGVCWRCGTEVKQKEIEQWFVKITDYTEELLDDSELDGWPQRVVTMEKNWIGKSYGTKIIFTLKGSDKEIPVFTTRPDTIFGSTYLVLAPEHPLAREIIESSDKAEELEEFVEDIINSDIKMRTAEETEKIGKFTGRYAINPVNNEAVPIWIGNYVVMEYGTGAVMCVPAHDQRDFEFAHKYNLPIRIVIQNEDKSLELDKMEEAYEGEGVLVNSEQFTGLESEQARKDIIQWMEQKGMGEATVHYRLRDWGISRQRYWGTPIPMVYCENCGVIPVPEADLPVKLPKDVEVSKTQQNPLLSVDDFVNTTCPQCDGKAKRETDTMDTFFDSAWYYARFCDPKNREEPFSKKAAEQWLPVDQYIGGIEHACLHLLYARFFHKFMRDIDLVDSDEFCTNLLTQGMVNKDGAKMSKSKGNVVDPETYIDRYGSDTLRVFLLFASPPNKDVEWDDKGVKGAFRFLNRIWKLVSRQKDKIKFYPDHYEDDFAYSTAAKKLRYSSHFTIKKVTEDIEERMHFNTAIAAVMEHLNNVSSFKIKKDSAQGDMAVYREAIEILPKLINPFAPHLAEEIWEMLGRENSVLEQGWLRYKEEFLVKEEITFVIQVNGKLRSKLEISPDLSREKVKELALQDEKIQKYIKGKEIKKIIIVPKKLINLVVA